MTSRGKRKPRYGFDEIVMPRRLPRTGTRRQADNAPVRRQTDAPQTATPSNSSRSLTHRPQHPFPNEIGERRYAHIDAGAVEHGEIGVAVLHADDRSRIAAGG